MTSPDVTPAGSDPADPLATSGIVVVDKPTGMTSHDVVSQLRRLFQTRRVGHAGTLDPLATGVLVVGVERGTKFLAHLVADTKSYLATIRLGQATTTDDAAGEVTATGSVEKLTEAHIRSAMEPFIGKIMQRPSAFSAIKIRGQRAHELARAGKQVDIPARPVTVSDFSLRAVRRLKSAGVEVVDIDVTVDCSSGTYVRSLARDLGESLGCGGHITKLRRTRVGSYSLADALSLTTLEEQPRLSLNLDEALIRSYPVLPVTADEGEALAMGKWLTPRGLAGVHAAVTPAGHAVALVREKGTRLSTLFVARPSTLR